MEYEEFKATVNDYKNSQKENINSNDLENMDDNILKFIYYYDRYYKIFFITTLGLILLLVALVIHKNRKNRL